MALVPPPFLLPRSTITKNSRQLLPLAKTKYCSNLLPRPVLTNGLLRWPPRTDHCPPQRRSRNPRLSVAAEYATGESQSNSFKNSLLPWYRKMLSKSAYEDEYEALVLSRQYQQTSMKRWPRETRQIRIDTCTTCTVLAPRTCPLIIARLFCRFQNLLTLGRNVLSKRLQLQTEPRLPAPNPNDCLPVLIDPATKNFANWLLSADLFSQNQNSPEKKAPGCLHGIEEQSRVGSGQC